MKNIVNWISVTDQMPKVADTDLNGEPLEFTESLLLFGNDVDDPSAKVVTIGFWNFDTKEWICECENVEMVTHWASLENIKPSNK